MHIDTPTDTFQPMAYESDKREFARHPKRNSFIRIEHPSEFDWQVSILDRCKMPLLRVLVFRFAPGIHARIPVFRGSQSANLNVSSDAEVGIILAGMVRDHGMNRAECLTYEAKREVELSASEAIN
ncbi:MAG: hypothetical protein P4L87_11615 [Formivibrio sp.]|nr:hypothetical protein [Formivibrio sp.]